MLLVFLPLVLAALSPKPGADATENGFASMYSTTLVDTHMIETPPINRGCVSSIDGPRCNQGPVSFLDGLFPKIIPEYLAYYFFQHTAQSHFRYEDGMPAVTQTELVLPAQTFNLFSCPPTLISPLPQAPSLPPWARIADGIVICDENGAIEFQSLVTIIQFAPAVVVDAIEGIRLSRNEAATEPEFPIILIGSNRLTDGAMWDILVTDDGIAPMLRKAPVDELTILGRPLQLTDFRVVYSPDQRPSSHSVWSLNIDPMWNYNKRVPERVTEYVDVTFNFNMKVPTIAPMSSLAEMRSHGYRLREDIVGPQWIMDDGSESRLPATQLTDVTEFLEKCIKSNCDNFHTGFTAEEVHRELDSIDRHFGFMNWEKVANARNFNGLFHSMWTAGYFARWKLILMRYRWNKWLKTVNTCPVPVSEAEILPPATVELAQRALNTLAQFQKLAHAITHKQNIYYKHGSIGIQFQSNEENNDISVTFSATASGRLETRVFSPTVEPNEFYTQLLGIPNRQFPYCPGPDPERDSQMERFNIFLADLMTELLDIDDHENIDARIKAETENHQKNRTETARAARAAPAEEPPCVGFVQVSLWVAFGAILLVTVWRAY